MVDFGNLENVDLRTAWQDEAKDFTPWLASHLERLSEVIGIPLESENTEVSVEQFSADIVARNSQDNTLVLIENQLTRSDHDHLGKVLTYLAGLETQTIIWIASEFTHAHLSAIGWLNEHTVEPFSFFAVRVKVVRIGESPLVPIFDVLERPNECERMVRSHSESAEPAEFTKYYLEFWDFYTKHYPDDLDLRKDYRHFQVFHPVKGLHVCLYLYPNAKQVGIILQSPAIYSGLGNNDRVQKDEIRIQLCRTSLLKQDQDLWQEGTRASLTVNVDLENRIKIADWFHEKFSIFCKVVEEKSSIDTDTTQL